MSTITKEWLQKAISQHENMRDEIPFGLDEDDSNTLVALRIALASLEAEPVSYIFKHPAGRLFWSLTDESNKGQSDVMPVYSAPVPAFVPPTIDPDYEVIKGIIPTANPDEYACCIAADMWNACRAAMLHSADGNSPVIPDGWKLVPVEPTMSQELAGYRTLTDTGKMSRLMKTRLSNIYRAMIASAPQKEAKP